jgi:hypothetical protein
MSERPPSGQPVTRRRSSRSLNLHVETCEILTKGSGVVLPLCSDRPKHPQQWIVPRANGSTARDGLADAPRDAIAPATPGLDEGSEPGKLNSSCFAS